MESGSAGERATGSSEERTLVRDGQSQMQKKSFSKQFPPLVFQGFSYEPRVFLWVVAGFCFPALLVISRGFQLVTNTSWCQHLVSQILPLADC